MAGSDNYNPFADAGAGAGQKTYMKFKGASGDFLHGKDEEEVPYGTQFAANVEQSKWNWTFWWEGEVLETLETFVARSPMEYDNEPDFLPDGYDGDMSLEEIRVEQADRKSNFMDGWSCQAVLEMRLVGGPLMDNPEHEMAFGEEFVIKLNQGVALSAFRAMLSSFGKQYRFKQGLVPIIEIDARSYVSKNKTVGKRYNPILKIVGWKSEEELMVEAGEDPDMYDEPDAEAEAPKDEPKQIESKAADKPLPDDEKAAADAGETEAPRRGRGRGRGKGYA